MLGRALGLFGFSRKTALEEIQDSPRIEEEEDVERNETPTLGVSLPAPEPSTPRARPATANPTAFKYLSRASGSLIKPVKRKRASDSERQDLYEVPGDTAQHNSEPEEASTNRAAKRARRGRAKVPLTIPKTSRGRTASDQTRQRRDNAVVEAAEVELIADVHAATINGAEPTTEVAQQQPKKRGRPRKIKNLPPSEVAHEPAVRKPNDTVSTDHSISVSVAVANRSIQTSGDAGEGVSEILLKPSPIKVLRQELQPAAPIAQRQKSPKLTNRVTIANGLPELSDDEDELFVSDGNVEEMANDSDEMEVEEDQEVADRASNEPRRTPFDPKIIDRMWETAKHVGYKFDAIRKTWSWDGKAEKLWTGPGKRMIGQLETLISAYENLQKSRSSRDKRAFRGAHEEVEKAFNLLSKETKVVLTKRFGPDSENKKAEAMLTDLYFNIIPKCIHALKRAVTVYDIRGSMETPALQEILELVDLIHDLAGGAVSQSKEIQPRPGTSRSYQISQPTRNNLPEIRNLQKRILAELRFRGREKERSKAELSRPERERQLLEEQEADDAEMRRKRAERRRLQGESWWAVKNNYFPGPWKRILQTDIANLEAARKGKGRQESVELGYPRLIRAESRRANSEESRQGVERVSVFPANNVKANNSMSFLSKEDTLIFIDCMRYEQGKPFFF